jgi:RsiW-degrading membrane proteinase PrsW (M82 family)
MACMIFLLKKNCVPPRAFPLSKEDNRHHAVYSRILCVYIVLLVVLSVKNHRNFHRNVFFSIAVVCRG